MTDMRKMQISGSIAVIGFVVSVACAILYFMRMPIFGEVTISWFFVIGLLSFAIGVLSLVLNGIWNQRDQNGNRY